MWDFGIDTFRDHSEAVSPSLTWGGAEAGSWSVGDDSQRGTEMSGTRGTHKKH